MSRWIEYYIGRISNKYYCELFEYNEDIQKIIFFFYFITRDRDLIIILLLDLFEILPNLRSWHQLQ